MSVLSLLVTLVTNAQQACASSEKIFQSASIIQVHFEFQVEFEGRKSSYRCALTDLLANLKQVGL
jgi:hypothetical protein